MSQTRRTVAILGAMPVPLALGCEAPDEILVTYVRVDPASPRPVTSTQTLKRVAMAGPDGLPWTVYCDERTAP